MALEFYTALAMIAAAILCPNPGWAVLAIFIFYFAYVLAD